jgi:hypothetical protein
MQQLKNINKIDKHIHIHKLEQNFEELKPAWHVPILWTILNIFDVFVAVFFSLLNSLNLVKRLITSRYLFLCVWICLSVSLSWLNKLHFWYFRSSTWVELRLTQIFSMVPSNSRWRELTVFKFQLFGLKLHPSWHIFLCAILFIYNKWCVFIIQ